ncbi:hypothetical protein DTO280E4_5198 [Paecilomyces variotii]|nr:hypothetical protein DTO021D3_6281 [Paecilomyces variotii]KAJ9340867.1 hypothetical protein DTO027B6_6554 [Paecilomyces variotii]KAJ9358439.1 hypothetical protein DTO280E4_5198 [Paecilomyces variotii]KAJ9380718.1 hypothetical protein DTO032I4_6539 [Paecilomyces variotii]
MRLFLGVTALCLALAPLCVAVALPIVDLGYELHQANPINISQGLYNFSNIRYAAPPVGDLRFRAPVSPEINRSEVQTGTVGRVCPQAMPLWATEIAPNFVETQLLGLPYSGPYNINSSSYPTGAQDPRTTEDCLFLDVVVPQVVFDRSRNSCGFAGVPVLVWLYGGGFTTGDKSQYDPSGLIHRSMEGGKDGIVYVALNYRLGAFGFLGGYSIGKDGTSNAGLLDQRLAIEWVHKYIHLFGGDPEKITIMGESAGGGSVLHQITAYGGDQGVAFKQAIIQSPGFVPMTNESVQEATLQQFLRIANVSTLEEARNLPSEKLIAANLYQVGVKSPYGTFTYGPVVDRTFAPALPGQLLQDGRFAKHVKVMVGHNADEGLEFTPPSSLNDSGFEAYLKQALPDVSPAVLNEITEVLYPPIYNGTYGYTTSVQRLSLAISDLAFQCSTDYLNRAYDNRTYAYWFTIPPALHGQDVPYTFFNGSNFFTGATTDVNTTVAIAMQQYITSFVETGVPKSSIGPVFNEHGEKGTMMDFSDSGISETLDNTDNARCRFWQGAPYAVN